MVTGVNNIFSLSRFGKLFCKDIVENKKMYLLGLLLTFGVQMIVFCWYIISIGNYKDMNGSYDVRVDKELLYMIWLALSCVFTTMVFSRADNKAKLISEIMLPASVLEKYVVKWVVCVLLFPVVYGGVVEMARLMSYMMLCGVYPNMQAIEFCGINESEVSLWICPYIFLQAIYMWGGVVMPRLSFLKTSGLVITFILLFAIELNFIENIITREIFERMISVASMLLYVIAYFAMKEKSVN
ncbi:MAG: hypothetical protein E7080_06060 [Bacteroidales bacterium]|nr:hypothetical protein [Bacteroidales bacterium]